MPAANTDKARKKKSNFSTTLSSAIGSGDTTIALNSVSGLATDTAITLTIDRTDANGTVQASSLWERVTGVVSGSSLTSALRGEDSTTAQAHSSGAVVEDIWDADTWNDLIDLILTGHRQDGKHNMTIVVDINGNETIEFGSVASAVDHVKLTNAATGGSPTVEAAGDDANIDLTVKSKGTGVNKFDAFYGAYTADTDGATVTFNMATSNKHTVTLGGNRTLAVSNDKVGQAFLIVLKQDATGSRTVTWWAGILWAGGSVPTLTTTANKADAFGFVKTATGAYYGFIVGQNL